MIIKKLILISQKSGVLKSDRISHNVMCIPVGLTILWKKSSKASSFQYFDTVPIYLKANGKALGQKTPRKKPCSEFRTEFLKLRFECEVQVMKKQQTLAREIPEPAPFVSQRGAQIEGLQIFPVIKITTAWP